jgi:hypothetical protein
MKAAHTVAKFYRVSLNTVQDDQQKEEILRPESKVRYITAPEQRYTGTFLLILAAAFISQTMQASRKSA